MVLFKRMKHLNPTEPAVDVRHHLVTKAARRSRPHLVCPSAYCETQMCKTHAQHARALDSTRLIPVQIISGDEQRTTLMIKNVPIRLQIHELAYLVDQSIHESGYDYIRLPQDDRRTRCNKGYAFVNCTSSEAVLELWAKWHCRSWFQLYPNCQKICEISFAQYQLSDKGCGMNDVQAMLSQSVMQGSVQLQKTSYPTLTTTSR